MRKIVALLFILMIFGMITSVSALICEIRPKDKVAIDVVHAPKDKVAIDVVHTPKDTQKLMIVKPKDKVAIEVGCKPKGKSNSTISITKLHKPSQKEIKGITIWKSPMD
ncbi:MAG: hypothetical protein AABW72_01085 [archaeon]